MAAYNDGANTLDSAVFKYLGLDSDDPHEQKPSSDPINFLQKHLDQLPQHLLLQFSSITTPKDRSVVTLIRNRRFKYTSANPPDLTGEKARDTWGELWTGPSEDEGSRIRKLQAKENSDEKSWAEHGFLDGRKQHVGKLGGLLGDYAEEREAERLRRTRTYPRQDDFVPEEESDSGDEMQPDGSQEQAFDVDDDVAASFERTLRERFIYGLLDKVDYDSVDWNDAFDEDNDREAEDRWFDEEEGD